MSDPVGEIKVCFYGDVSVGKTTINHRCLHEEFVEGLTPTLISADFTHWTVHYGSIPIQLQIWDTAGEERFRATNPIYGRGAKLVVLVFDVTREESFKGVSKWVDMIRDCTESETPVILVGNKIDMISERLVTLEDMKRESEKLGINGCIEVSAKSGDGIDDLKSKMACLVGPLVTDYVVTKREEFGVDLEHPIDRPGELRGGRCC
jgi:small GTP-binding protein